jgi:TonB family protein
MRASDFKYRHIFLVLLLLLLGIDKSNAQNDSLNKGAQNDESKCDFKKYAPIKMEHFPAEAILKKVVPKYPPKARKQKIEGTVSVKILINEKGIVEKACAFSGEKVLWVEAEKAALRWKFKPKYGLAFTAQRHDRVKKRYAFAYISFTFKLPVLTR